MTEKGRSPTVVFADDEPAIRRLFAAALEGTGIVVAEAADGELALAMVREVQPDLVVLDIAMPRMDGLAVCRALKSDPSTSRIPVWLLSAYVGTADGRLHEEAADERIEKPFSPLDLRARIERALGQQATSAPVRHPEQAAAPE